MHVCVLYFISMNYACEDTLTSILKYACGVHVVMYCVMGTCIYMCTLKCMYTGIMHVSMYCAHVYACHVCKRVLCTCLLVFNMHVLNICMYWAKVFVHMCVHVQMLGVTCEVHAHMNSACIHARAHLLYMYRSV